MIKLDSQQLAAAESRAPATVVIASPGSGKSRTLIARIHWLIANGAAPDDIMAVTFTNAGANELRERLGGIKLGFLGTLHGWCFRILQRHGNAIGYRDGGINLLSADQAEEMLDQAAERLHWKGSKKALLEAKIPLAQLIHKEHRHTMRRSNIVDYDGVLVDALKLLEVREPTAAFFTDPMKLPKHLLVDECQDNAEIDWDIYRVIDAQSAFFVGDSDQGVFSFRGASPEAFTRFASQHHPLFLEWNYRSGLEICEAANLLIACNADRIPKSTIPIVPRASKVTARGYNSCILERDSVAAQIGIKLGAGHSPNEIAVLCRTNDLATKFRDHLAASGVQVRRPKQTQLPLDWSHALNVLSLWNDPRNDIVCERVLKGMTSGHGVLNAMKKEAVAKGIWLASVARSYIAIPEIQKEADVRAWSDLPRWNIGRESMALIDSRIAQLPQSNPTLPDLLHDLYNSANWDTNEDGSGVTVSTIHASKGTERSVVFLPAWEEGVIPQQKKDTSEAEERRLAFVGITRARNEVHISYARERVGQWKTVNAEPSRFIREAGLNP